MHSFRYLLLAATLLTMWATAASASARSWDVDAAHSNIYFTVKHVYAKVIGRFKEAQMQLVFDPEHLDQSRFDCTIMVGSIDTGEPERDKHLRGADFFASDTYRQITFTSTAITQTNGDEYRVSGTLNVKGVDHQVSFPLIFAGIMDHPMLADKQVIGFNGFLPVDRLALNIGNGQFYQRKLVDKDVEILITIEALADK
ncbi:MAG: YceI family protein [Desulfopila sp.]